MTEHYYEGMFVTHNKEARGETDYLVDHVRELIEKAGGRVEQICKWDERKLAYEIKKVTHGVYVLAWFAGDPGMEQRLRGEVRLSQFVLRHLVLRLEGKPTGKIETFDEIKARLSGDERRTQAAAAPQAGAEAQPAKAESEVALAEAPALDETGAENSGGNESTPS